MCINSGLTVYVALFALVFSSEAVAGDLVVMVDALGSNKAQILPLVTLVQATFVDVLVLGRDERCDGQQIGRCLSGAQNYVSNAADERLNYVLDTVQLLFRT